VSANGNFVQIRRGILQHVETRRLSAREFAAYTLIVLLADSSTGVWWGNSVALAAKFGSGDVSELAAQKTLRSLGEKGYIKSLRQPGSRASYPIIVNRYKITVGKLAGGLVNAENTTDWRKPAVFPVSEEVGETVSDAVGDAVSEEVGETVTPYSRSQEVKSQEVNTPRPQDVRTPVAPAAIQTGQTEDAIKLARFMFYDFFEYEHDHEPTLNGFIKFAPKVLECHDYDQAIAALSFAKESGFWFKKLTEVNQPMAFLAKSIDTIVEQRAERKNRPAAQAKAPAEVAKETKAKRNTGKPKAEYEKEQYRGNPNPDAPKPIEI
jgi:hypothetical protein